MSTPRGDASGVGTAMQTWMADHERYEQAAVRFHEQTERPLADGSDDPVSWEWAIPREAGRFLFDRSIAFGPCLTIEIGLCQGSSAFHLSAARAVSGGGMHFAVDPFQQQFFRNHGREALSRAGLAPWFRHIDRRSDLALPLLAAADLAFDIVFIDGDHRFDAVFTDYVFADKLLRPGGLLIFDEGGYDCPTQRVARFIESNMANYARQPGPERFYCYAKTGQDERSFADQHEF